MSPWFCFTNCICLLYSMQPHVLSSSRCYNIPSPNRTLILPFYIFTFLIFVIEPRWLSYWKVEFCILSLVVLGPIMDLYKFYIFGHFHLIIIGNYEFRSSYSIEVKPLAKFVLARFVLVRYKYMLLSFLTKHQANRASPNI